MRSVPSVHFAHVDVQGEVRVEERLGRFRGQLLADSANFALGILPGRFLVGACGDIARERGQVERFRPVFQLDRFEPRVLSQGLPFVFGQELGPEVVGVANGKDESQRRVIRQLLQVGDGNEDPSIRAQCLRVATFQGLRDGRADTLRRVVRPIRHRVLEQRVEPLLNAFQSADLDDRGRLRRNESQHLFVLTSPKRQCKEEGENDRPEAAEGGHGIPYLRMGVASTEPDER